MRQFFLDLARSGSRMPIGTDMVLHEHPDAQEIVLDGRRLGEVMRQAAERYRMPVAIPLMDLRLEKADLLGAMGIPEPEADAFQFKDTPPAAAPAGGPFPAGNQAHFDSIRYIKERTSLLPMGMAIGPFSLTTKLMADPITAIAMAGMGLTAEEDPGVRMAERCLALAEWAVARSLKAQMQAGARAILVCEPAANIVFLSPRQIESGADIFERFVMQPNLRLKAVLAEGGAELVFHDCGQLNTFMVREFAARLHPAVLSLGGSRKLWEDAAVAPKDVVLFGNLPTKNFYSDSVVPVVFVAELTTNLIARMRKAAHPHILGSECDVLYVPEAAATIRRKVEVMLTCGAAKPL